jgi:peptidoglycan biosynthesis protein MviN/MurJ (putative lipid II flippase)
MVLIILALADPFFGVGQVFAQAHIGRGDTRTPMYVGFWRIGFKALCSAALVPLIGIFGLATASALSSVFRTVALWRRLPDAVRPTVAEFLRPLAPTVVPALIAIAASLAVQYIVPLPPSLAAVAVGATSATAFVVAAVALGHWMIRDLRARARRRG